MATIPRREEAGLNGAGDSGQSGNRLVSRPCGQRRCRGRWAAKGIMESLEQFKSRPRPGFWLKHQLKCHYLPTTVRVQFSIAQTWNVGGVVVHHPYHLDEV